MPSRSTAWAVVSALEYHRPPAALIEKAMATIPPEITIPGRTPDRDYVMGGDRLGFVNFGSTVWLNDINSGKRRKALKKDVIEVTRVMEPWQG